MLETDKIVKEIQDAKDLKQLELVFDQYLGKKWLLNEEFKKMVNLDAEQKKEYGKILSDLLGLEEVMLAKSGSSIFWAVDQILRSDIKKDDIVVWGITNSSRVNYSNSFNLESVPINGYSHIKDQFWNIDYFDSIALTVSNHKQILQVINYCNQVGAKLYLVNLLDHGLISLLLR